MSSLTRKGSFLIHLSFWNKWYLKYYIFIGRFIQEKELFDPLLWQKFCRILHVTCIFNKKWIKKNNWSLCPKWTKTYINHAKKSDQKIAFFIQIDQNSDPLFRFVKSSFLSRSANSGSFFRPLSLFLFSPPWILFWI